MNTDDVAARNWLIWSGIALVTPLSVHAQQEPGDPRRFERIDVTGSNIKRSDIETAIPSTTAQ